MKTRLVAIAKDEGAYLADWVFHHRNFGFDEVHVCLNRTTDGSVEVLERLKERDPAVSFEHVDWIDYCPAGLRKHMQTIAYAKALGEARRDGIDWLMFLDVDEFWVPADFVTPIHAYLDILFSDQPAGAVCHLWHNEHGRESAFAPIAVGPYFSVAPNVKSLFPVTSVHSVGVHVPRMNKDFPIYDADGVPMTFYENTHRAARNTLGVKSAFVLHRMYRSETEYLATTLRGNPERDDYGLKRNRKGYLAAQSNRGGRLWPSEAHDAYLQARDRFIQEAGLWPLLEQEQNRVRQRAAIAERRLREMLDQTEDQAARELASRIVSGLSMFDQND
ncbi:glycosyltransferase family 2 protein [Halomonas sp. DN3]|uniref:glycosyltransferase family 2 protein n=1 Tax=Halomonas sp. DN3 TaxID=2953657 RepID=UPI00209E2703|nr:glycosyltransferase family 2 protein [Halomonas sp. DN3]USZ49716.1 glycosyltransferase family 2 protein [Halomonas sp. DN3]